MTVTVCASVSGTASEVSLGAGMAHDSRPLLSICASFQRQTVQGRCITAGLTHHMHNAARLHVNDTMRRFTRLSMVTCCLTRTWESAAGMRATRLSSVCVVSTPRSGPLCSSSVLSSASAPGAPKYFWASCLTDDPAADQDMRDCQQASDTPVRLCMCGNGDLAK